MSKTDDVWGVSQIWNTTLENQPERELVKRDHLWASEIGGSMVDNFLKMKGVKQTNPPQIRSKRKFEAGNFMEWVVIQVLKRSGVFIDSQRHTAFQYPGLLEVTGRVDAIAGGKIDLSKSVTELKKLELPEFFSKASQSILAFLAGRYPNGLKEMPVEVKSISMWVYEKYDRIGPNVHNLCQLFHYLKGENYERGNVLYVCRDDLRMLEYPVLNPGPVEEIYKSYIEQMTKFVKADEQPPLEPLLIYEDGKFNFNWKVEYSGYLTMLYNFKNSEHYQETFKGQIRTWNYTLKRLRDNKKLTKNNEEVLAEMQGKYPDVDFKQAPKVEEKADEKETEPAGKTAATDA